MSIIKTYLVCRRAIHSKVIIKFTCFEAQMENINKTMFHLIQSTI